MEIFLLIVLSAATFALVYYLQTKKKNELLVAGKIIDRGNDYFKQSHFFTTKTDSVKNIGNCINMSILQEEQIAFTPAYEQNILFFNKNGFGGTFGAALRSMGKENDLYRYRFQVESWRETDHTITRQDIFGANVLLTAIEKAFLQLDENTDVQRQKAVYKTKTKFF